MTHNVVGLDLSLTGAGVGVIDRTYPSAPAYLTYTFGMKGTNADPLRQRLMRIARTADQIIETVTSVDDVVLATIETPAYDQTTGKSHDRSGLWWEVVRQLTLNGIPVVEVGTSGVKIYATGKGNTGKQAVLLEVVRRYVNVEIQNDNEADAWVLACIAARLIGSPVDEVPKTHARAIDALSLPEGFELP